MAGGAAAGPMPLLAACSQEAFEHLFADPPSCYAVFTLLPPLASEYLSTPPPPLSCI